MLKRTSKHHQPAHLAAAVALGIVAGLVPKANLLAIGLYAALLLLPIHTLLALGVSMVVAFIAGYLDPLTHRLGSWLLRQEMLQPLWYRFDNTAVLPWLGLHNTVVLGSFVSGVCAAAPSYLVALRLFERLRWTASTGRTEARGQSVFLSPELVETAIAPRPHFIGLPQSAIGLVADKPLNTSIGDEEFEPVREVAAIIHGWHMGHASKKASQPHMLSALSAPKAHALLEPIESPGDANRRSNSASDDAFRPRSFTPPPKPWVGERSEIVDSLDLAHNASEVLDWVDGMLKECLSEDSTPIIYRNTSQSDASAASSAYVSSEELQQAGDTGQEQWLMETTIEVVRWGNDSPPFVPPAAATKDSDASTGDARLHPLSSSPSALPSFSEKSMHDPARSVSFGCSSSSNDGNTRCASSFPNIPSGSGLPVSASLPLEVPAERASDLAASQSDEVPRGECLGFLLGHLRQEREGKSS